MQYKFQFQLNQISTKSKNTRLQSKSYMRPPCPWSVLKHFQGGSHQRSLSHQSRRAYLKPRTLGGNKANMAKQQEESVLSQATPYQSLSAPPTCRSGILQPWHVPTDRLSTQLSHPHQASTSATPHVSISFNIWDPICQLTIAHVNSNKLHNLWSSPPPSNRHPKLHIQSTSMASAL